MISLNMTVWTAICTSQKNFFCADAIKDGTDENSVYSDDSCMSLSVCHVLLALRIFRLLLRNENVWVANFPKYTTSLLDPRTVQSVPNFIKVGLAASLP